MDKQAVCVESMMGLKEKMNSILRRIIPEGSTIYFFDYPVHGNVGDMLIWKGTENFFRESSIKVKRRYSNHQILNKLKNGKSISIPQDVIIVCHGGGNFGDLYIQYQNVRKLLVNNFSSHRIVFLPQTIYYQDIKKMEDDFNLFKKHQDLHIFTRDMESLDIAKKYLNNVYVCPDMAHSLYPINTNGSEEFKTLHLIRRDKESSDLQQKSYEESKTFDWPSLYNNLEKGLISVFISAHSSSKLNAILPTMLLPKLWLLFTNYSISKAIMLYNEHHSIITSRLHGHILACLMNKNSELIDNSYGKNSSYYKTWTYSVVKLEISEE
ncbi:polysaccharide pyruvyl transferase family protein [Aquibacillus halophilus]|nr:polysaccharide pyruvyl transferase family protein [Aquibacillus halophilus]